VDVDGGDDDDDDDLPYGFSSITLLNLMVKESETKHFPV